MAWYTRSSRPTARAAALALLAMLPALASCDPSELPAYSPDGRYVVALIFGERPWLGRYDTKTKAVEEIVVPPPWTPMSARWVGGRLWIDAHRRLPERPVDSVDGPREEWQFAPYNFDTRKLDPPAFPPVTKMPIPETQRAIAGYQGQLCILQFNWPQTQRNARTKKRGGLNAYDVFSLTHHRRLGTADLINVQSAGGGWSVAQFLTGEHRTRVVISDPRGKVAGTIEPGAQEDLVGPMEYLRVSPGGKEILLVFGNQEQLTAAMFDVATGRRLWRVKGSPRLRLGTPAIRKDEVWALHNRLLPQGDHGRETEQGPSDPGGLILARYTPATVDAANTDGACQEIMTYDLGPGNAVQSYAPSPNGSELLAAIGGKEPRLLFIPLRQDVIAAQVTVVKLR